MGECVEGWGRVSEMEREIREEKEGQEIDRWEECVQGMGRGKLNGEGIKGGERRIGSGYKVDGKNVWKDRVKLRGK